MSKAVKMTLAEQYSLLDVLNKRNLARIATLEAKLKDAVDALETLRQASPFCSIGERIRIASEAIARIKGDA